MVTKTAEPVVKKDLVNKIFNNIDPWGETLAYIAWTIRSSYQRTIMATPGQSVFVRDIIINLASVIDWQVVAAANKQQVDIGNVQENARRITHDYAIGNRVYI